MAVFPWGRKDDAPPRPLTPNERYIKTMDRAVNGPDPADKQPGLFKSLFSRAPIRQETAKPLYDVFYLGTGPRVQLPRFMVSYWELFELAFLSPEVRMIVEQIAKEAFRNGGEWVPRWKRKCLTCKRVYNRIPHINYMGTKIEGCEGCKVPGTLAEPNPEEIEYARWLFEHANNQETRDVSGESVMDLFYQLSWDLDVVDNGWLIMVKEYFWDDAEARVYAHPKEILRGHPLVMRIVADDRGARGGKYLSCPCHRDYVYEIPTTGTVMGSFGGLESGFHALPSGHARLVESKEAPPKYCPECAKLGRYVTLRQIWYVATEMGGSRPTAFYFADEVVHVKKHTRGLFYGVPPLLTLYRVVRTLIKMDEYMHEYMERRRIPRGIVMVRRQSSLPGIQSTPNQLEIDEMKTDFNQRAQNDPHDIPFVAVGGDDVQFLPFADTIREMDLVNVRREMRERVGAYYGVQPVFQGDSSVGGGLNNEGLQITVTNRSIEHHQKIFNERIIPFLVTQLGVENWEYRLKPSEEKDEAHEWDLKLKADQRASNRKAMGFPVWINDFDDYEFGHEAVDTQAVPGEDGGLDGGANSAHPGESEEDLTEGIESPGKPDGEQRFGGEPAMPKHGRETHTVPYRGPKGGTGAINPNTGRVYYGLGNKFHDSLRKAVDMRKAQWVGAGCGCTDCRARTPPNMRAS